MTLLFATDPSRPNPPAPEDVPPRWDPEAPGLEIWRDNDGRACAYGLLRGRWHWLHVLGAGSYRFEATEGPTLVVPDEGAARSTVLDAFYRIVLPMVLQARGREALHASAVELPHGVLALCAPRETGKSTLAFGLQRRGHPAFADDAVVFRAEPGRATVTRVPFAFRLRPASAEHFGHAARDLVRVTEDAPPREAPLAALGVLERFPDEPGSTAVRVERLPSAEAFRALLPHAYCFGLRDEARKGRMMRQYLALAAAVPVLRVRFRPGLERLPAILDELERAVGEAAAQPAAR